MRYLLKIGALLAATAIAIIPNSVIAGAVTVATQTHSQQGLNGVTANQTSNVITYTLGVGYAVGDTISFTIGSGAYIFATAPMTITVPAVDASSISNAIAGLELAILNSDANSVSYRVIAVNQPDDTPGAGGTPYVSVSTLGAAVVLGSMDYAVAALSSADLSVTVSSENSIGGAIDSSGSRTAILAQARSQFGSATVSPTFDNIIDIEASRTTFTSGPTDSIRWTESIPNTTGWLNLATVTKTTVTLFGEAGKMDSFTISNFNSPTATLQFTPFRAELIATLSGAHYSVPITFNAPGNVVLEEQKFDVRATHDYTSAAGINQIFNVNSYQPAGEWTLDGGVVIIPYMPYSANASQIMYITNTGAQTGDILVEAIDENGSYWDLGTIGQAQGGKITKIAKLISDKLASKGFTGGKLTFYIKVIAPKNQIHVYASFNAGGVRNFVQVQHIR